MKYKITYSKMTVHMKLKFYNEIYFLFHSVFFLKIRHEHGMIHDIISNISIQFPIVNKGKIKIKYSKY